MLQQNPAELDTQKIDFIPIDDSAAFKQIYTQNWLSVRNAIKADTEFGFRSSTIDSLLFLQDNVDYREGFVMVNADSLKDYLGSSRATAYAVLKWFKDNDVLVPVKEGQKVTSYKLSNLAYSMGEEILQPLQRASSVPLP